MWWAINILELYYRDTLETGMWFLYIPYQGFPDGSVGNVRDLSLIPEWGRSPGEGNGNPLQYSCLENFMDRGARWVTVHAVTKNQTQLIYFLKISPQNLYFTVSLGSSTILKLYDSYICIPFEFIVLLSLMEKQSSKQIKIAKKYKNKNNTSLPEALHYMSLSEK